MTSNKGQPADLISSYRRRRQQRGPYLIIGAAVLLVVVGIILIVTWLVSSGGPKFTLFATKTPTPTLTFTPTNTSNPTDTPTITLTPTETMTPTPSSPFIYTVVENDSLSVIVEKFGLGTDGLALLYILNPPPTVDPCNPLLHIGDKLTIPNPGMLLPTSTPVAASIPFGTKATYVIKPGDNVAAIAALFNSTIDDILKQNNIADANTIVAGVCITVRINLVTPTPTLRPTLTPTSTP
jgi:LysM repeat protein